ncbi:MAG TPA: 3'-5' exonuclease [Ignavibacteria bacterium]|nr:3'-5' exonuclease [Ignavibacteria bacterium]
MKLTTEQIDIINSTGDIKINAVAGSGKTTTIIEYAAARPKESKILYLAFNKSVKLEAIRKFSDKGLDNVKVETAHSLAYRHIVYNYNYRVKANGYSTNEIVELLKLRSTGEKHTEYIVANHIKKFIAYFCNSDVQKVQELNYLDVVSDKKAASFVKAYYDYIENQTRNLLGKMNKGEIEIIHDFYLKKFQLSAPKLEYDYILFDEGQDASPAMLDVFLKQDAVKVVVGDTHQQIYSWRFAVNSLEKAGFKTYQLSTSFRFSQDIANLAVEVLKYKKHFNLQHKATINGKGNFRDLKTKAILARTNLGLLLRAIKFVTEKKNVKNIYFEGNINSYTYADEGTSLYDVLNLYNGKSHLIKDSLLKAMKNMDELKDYIEKTEDVQLGMMVSIVSEYGNRIPGIINIIKKKHLGNEDREKAEMIFSTVHRCKGMEYDEVHLVNDFMTEVKLEKLTMDKTANVPDQTKLNEEINLLYVAITRAKNSVHIPEQLMPKEFPRSSQIHIIKTDDEDRQQTKPWSSWQTNYKTGTVKDKSIMIDELRMKHSEAFMPWTRELDSELRRMFDEGISVNKIAKQFGRTKGAIAARLEKLQLV